MGWLGHGWHVRSPRGFAGRRSAIPRDEEVLATAVPIDGVIEFLSIHSIHMQICSQYFGYIGLISMSPEINAPPGGNALPKEAAGAIHSICSQFWSGRLPSGRGYGADDKRSCNIIQSIAAGASCVGHPR
jgi:hypothetical protein